MKEFIIKTEGQLEQEFKDEFEKYILGNVPRSEDGVYPSIELKTHPQKEETKKERVVGVNQGLCKERVFKRLHRGGRLRLKHEA